MSSAIQVYTMAGSREEADRIAAQLVERRLAACAQVSGPVQSRYWWEGKVEQSEEWLCTIKTLDTRFAELERMIQSVHSYDEPEIIAVPIVYGSHGYLRWLTEQLEKTEE